MSELYHTIGDRTISLKYPLRLVSRLSSRLSFLHLMRCQRKKASICYVQFVLWGFMFTAQASGVDPLLVCFLVATTEVTWSPSSKFCIGSPSPHSTRSVTSSIVLAKDGPLHDVLQQVGPLRTCSSCFTVWMQIQHRVVSTSEYSINQKVLSGTQNCTVCDYCIVLNVCVMSCN